MFISPNTVISPRSFKSSRNPKPVLRFTNITLYYRVIRVFVKYLLVLNQFGYRFDFKYCAFVFPIFLFKLNDLCVRITDCNVCSNVCRLLVFRQSSIEFKCEQFVRCLSQSYAIVLLIIDQQWGRRSTKSRSRNKRVLSGIDLRSRQDSFEFTSRR